MNTRHCETLCLACGRLIDLVVLEDWVEMVPERMSDDALTDRSPQRSTAFTGIVHWISRPLIPFLPSLAFYPFFCSQTRTLPSCIFCSSHLFAWCNGISPNWFWHSICLTLVSFCLRQFSQPMALIVIYSALHRWFEEKNFYILWLHKNSSSALMPASVAPYFL